MQTFVVEQFSKDELKTLRDELRHSGLDSFQCAELLTAFLSQHGYGVSHDDARRTASRMEIGCTLPYLQAELEKLALVM